MDHFAVVSAPGGLLGNPYPAEVINRDFLDRL